eukprot:5864769-Pyramimonas_sp.AAC.1
MGVQSVRARTCPPWASWRHYRTRGRRSAAYPGGGEHDLARPVSIMLAFRSYLGRKAAWGSEERECDQVGGAPWPRAHRGPPGG